MSREMTILKEKLFTIEQSIQTRVPLLHLIKEIKEVHLRCRELEWQEGIARCCFLEGQFAALQRQYEIANKFFSEGFTISTQLAFTPGIIDSHYGFGTVAYKEGKIDIAFKFIKEAYELAKTHKRWYQIVQCEWRLALINKLYDSDDEALYYYLNSLSLSQAHGFLYIEAQLHYSLTSFYLVAENLTKARRHAEDSLAMSSLLHIDTSDSEINLITVILETEAFHEAEGKLKALQEKYNNPDNSKAGIIHICLARLLQKQNNFCEAQKQTELGLKIYRKVKNPHLITNAEILLAEIFLAQNNIPQATSQAEIALESSRSTSNLYSIKEALRLLYRIHKQNNNLDKAISYLEEYDKTNKKSNEALLQKRIEYAELKLQFEKEQALVQQEHERVMNLNSELEQKEFQLRERTRYLITQSELLSRFHDEMKATVAHLTGTDPVIKEIKEKLKELPLQMDWKKFETEFTAVHPEFVRKLHEQFPKLTPTEMKMCSLLRLNLRSQEIARLLNLAERSVETHRFNIRRKLEIDREKSLGEFLNTL